MKQIEKDWNVDQTKNQKHYIECKDKLEKYYTRKTKGAIIRSRVKWYEEGEKNTKYFMGLEKSNSVKKSISVLKKQNGKSVN